MEDMAGPNMITSERGRQKVRVREGDMMSDTTIPCTVAGFEDEKRLEGEDCRSF